MKRHSSKTQVFVSGLFFVTILGALAVFFGQTNNFCNTFTEWITTQVKQVQARQIPPLRGHWLRTGDDKYNPPALEDMTKAANTSQRKSVVSSVFTLEEAKTKLNIKTDSINIMYVWCDSEQLKVISVTSFNKTSKQAAIVVIPLYTVIDNGQTVNLQNNYKTIQDLYRVQGREGVRRFLEQKLEIKIPNFVQVNQSALRKLSDIIGVLEVNGDNTTMLEAFEQTAAGIRTDDREVVRAVASQVLRPGIILEIPDLLSIFTHDIQTNFSTQEMLQVFYFSRQMNLKEMRKAALPGYEYYQAPTQKFLFVSEQAWKNIIYNITQSLS